MVEAYVSPQVKNDSSEFVAKTDGKLQLLERQGLRLSISHTKTCQLFPAKIEILDLIEFFVDLKNPKIHPDPFSEGLL